MTGRFLTPKDMSAARHEQERINSMVKRGEIVDKDVVREQHVVCGCGAVGCIFISKTKRTKEEQEFDKRHSQFSSNKYINYW